VLYERSGDTLGPIKPAVLVPVVLAAPYWAFLIERLVASGSNLVNAAPFLALMATILNAVYGPFLGVLSALHYVRSRQASWEPLVDFLHEFESLVLPENHWQREIARALHAQSPTTTGTSNPEKP